MAEVDTTQQEEVIQESENSLKYLDFVQVATLHVIAYFSSFYNYAKENSGPLKPGVQTVEDTVKTVVSPVYEKFRDVPLELLTFVDRRVDSSVSELESHVPSLVKQASYKAYSVAQKGPEVVRSVASEIKRAGLVDTATGIAQSVCTKYSPVGEKYAVSAWRKLNQLPVFPQVAQVVVPTAAYWADKYNDAVSYTSEKGYAVSSYLPLVPKERIAKLFGEEEAKTEESTVTNGVEDAAAE